MKKSSKVLTKTKSVRLMTIDHARAKVLNNPSSESVDALIQSVVKECASLADEWEDVIKHEGTIPMPGDHIRSFLSYK